MAEKDATIATLNATIATLTAAMLDAYMVQADDGSWYYTG